MARNILLVTTDQQRYEALGCNGGKVARTPVVDQLAADGVVYRRAYNHNTVCMPARSTLLTGQYPRTHGVVANGIPLPADAPSVAAWLRDRAGYRTALFGKAHFEPGVVPDLRFEEEARAERGERGEWRGFETSVQAMHVPAVGPRLVAHYGRWLAERGPEYLHTYAQLLGHEPGGDTGAPETADNPIPRELYHTDWVADLAVAWLAGLADDEPWFCWVSFPDPHHPFDPPSSELGRVPWRDLDLPPGHPGSDEAIRRILADKPAHWLGWYEGRFANLEGGAAGFVPAAFTDDQLREILARTHVMNELIDEACGRILACVAARGRADDTDVLFTTDHGDLLGDFGLLFKGPYHTDALMRLPLVWRPAPSAGVTPAEVSEPVGQVDVAPTLCAIAGIERPAWMQGRPLPTAPGSDRERVICEWDSQFPGYGMHLRSIYRDGWLCTVYEPSTAGRPNGLEKVLGDRVLRPIDIQYEGTEGELYHVTDDPHCFVNRWNERAWAVLRSDLVTDLYDHRAPERPDPLEVAAPV